jgi:membrane-associated phospholipid phosphatase
VIAYADQRGEHGAEIASQIMWPLDAWVSLLGMRPREHSYTLLLLRIGQELVVHLNRRLKHLCGIARPSQLSPQVQPMIDVPQHGSWPGGHASEGFMTASLLLELIKTARPLHRASLALLDEQLNGLAARIATNRVVAGLHYPIDTEVGMIVGQRLGKYLISLCKPGNRRRAVNAYRFANKDSSIGYFDFKAIPKGLTPDGLIEVPATAHSLKFFWDQAIKEWK